jgi:predicted  nucleic acid-binding Zn-ribbon protein
MTKEIYLQDLKRRIAALEARIEADRKKLGRGTPQQEVHAAGDLALVEDQLAETKRRLAQLEAEPEGAWEDFKAKLEEALDDVETAIEGWIRNK